MCLSGVDMTSESENNDGERGERLKTRIAAESTNKSRNNTISHESCVVNTSLTRSLGEPALCQLELEQA